MPSTYDDLSFPSADGRLQLFARDYPGRGVPLLMMHGLTRNSADFEGLADQLAGKYRLIVPDQRGRGRSDHDPEPSHYALDRYCADTLALIDRLGLERPVLIGTSMGGLMAMAMGSIAPSAYRGIVLNDVGPVVEAAGLERIAKYVGGTAQVTDWDSAADYCRETNGDAFPGYGDAEWMSFARRLFREDGEGVPHLAYDPAISAGLKGDEPSAVPPDLWPMWHALKPVPILAIRGARSDILSSETLAKMAARHPGMKAIEVPGVGHAPMLDEPEAVTVIEAFLDEICAGTVS